MINWKVRFANKHFWIALVPAVLFLFTSVCSVFGFPVDFSALETKLLMVVESIFAIYGIILDPTTYGSADSLQAMTYKEPKRE